MVQTRFFEIAKVSYVFYDYVEFAPRTLTFIIGHYNLAWS